MKKMFAMLVLTTLLAMPLNLVLADESTVTASVDSYASLTLSSGYQNNVTFGALTHNTANNNATGNGNGVDAHSTYTVTVNTNTDNATLQYSSTDFTGAGTIGKANFGMYKSVDPSYATVCDASSVKFSSDQYEVDLVDDDVVYSNFCLDVPSGQTSGNYEATLTVAVST
jgi:hypothetical protein